MKKFVSKSTAAAVASSQRSQGARSTARRDLRSYSVTELSQSRASARQAEEGVAVPVSLNVWKYTSSAKDFVSSAPEDEALFLAVLGHPGKPSVTDGILKALGDFLQSTSWKEEDDEEKPGNLQELRGAGVNLQMTWLKKAGEEVPNPDGAPWQNGSVAFYVIGADTLRDLPDLLGRFVAWRAGHPQASVDRAEWPEMSELKLVIRTHEDFEMQAPNLEEELGLSVELLASERVRDASPFCVQPPYGVQNLSCDLQVISDNDLLAAWDGKTYGYRVRFEAVGIPRAAGSEAKNLRLLPQDRRDVSKPSNVDFLLEVFGGAVLRDAVVCVRLREDHVASANSPVGRALDRLRALPSLHWDVF